jgi:hypothetical protein
MNFLSGIYYYLVKFEKLTECGAFIRRLADFAVHKGTALRLAIKFSI